MKRNVALILLFDKDKKILLQLRDENAERLPGCWAFFGGGIDNGETPEKAVRRETLEELEYELINPKLIMTQKFSEKHHHGTAYVFMEEYGPSKKLILREGQAMKWYTLDEAINLRMSEHDIEVLKYIKNKY